VNYSARIPRARARRLHLRLCSWLSMMSIRNYFRPSNGFLNLRVPLSVALKSRKQGTSSPPCARSAEYFLRPVTVHSIVPPRRKSSEHTRDTFQGK